jgi:hypothetical protein
MKLPSHLADKFIIALGSVILASLFAGCVSEVDETEGLAHADAALSVCGGAASGSFAELSTHHRYPLENLNVDCASTGATISIYVAAYDVPNKFTILDATGNLVTSSGWLGVANYSGPWTFPLNNSGVAVLSFTKASPAYSVLVETVTPPDGSYPHTTDVWYFSASCQCAPGGC